DAAVAGCEAHVLAQHDQARIAAQGDAQGVLNRLDHGHLRHSGPPRTRDGQPIGWPGPDQQAPVPSGRPRPRARAASPGCAARRTRRPARLEIRLVKQPLLGVSKWIVEARMLTRPRQDYLKSLYALGPAGAAI